MPVTDLSDPSNWPANRRRDTAGVIAAPPVLFGAALILGLLLQNVHPARISAVAGDALRLIGVLLVLIGLLLSIAVMHEFSRRERTCHLTGKQPASSAPALIGTLEIPTTSVRHSSTGASPWGRTAGGRCSS